MALPHVLCGLGFRAYNFHFLGLLLGFVAFFYGLLRGCFVFGFLRGFFEASQRVPSSFVAWRGLGSWGLCWMLAFSYFSAVKEAGFRLHWTSMLESTCHLHRHKANVRC